MQLNEDVAAGWPKTGKVVVNCPPFVKPTTIENESAYFEGRESEKVNEEPSLVAKGETSDAPLEKVGVWKSEN